MTTIEQKINEPRIAKRNTKEVTIANATLRESEGCAPITAAPRSRPSQVANIATRIRNATTEKATNSSARRTRTIAIDPAT